jgi:hypothetical protein
MTIEAEVIMKYQSPMWAEARANRNIYITEDLARSAEIEALSVYKFINNASLENRHDY